MLWGRQRENMKFTNFRKNKRKEETSSMLLNSKGNGWSAERCGWEHRKTIDRKSVV